MAKWLSKEEKYKNEKIIYYEHALINPKIIGKTTLGYGIGRPSIKEWIKAYKLLGEKGLEYGNVIRRWMGYTLLDTNYVDKWTN